MHSACLSDLIFLWQVTIKTFWSDCRKVISLVDTDDDLKYQLFQHGADVVVEINGVENNKIHKIKSSNIWNFVIDVYLPIFPPSFTFLTFCFPFHFRFLLFPCFTFIFAWELLYSHTQTFLFLSSFFLISLAFIYSFGSIFLSFV